MPELAHARLGEGRCLLALGRSDTTISLESAHELLRRLGARPLLAETDGLLGQALALRRRRLRGA